MVAKEPNLFQIAQPELVLNGKDLHIMAAIFLSNGIKASSTLHTITFTETRLDVYCARLLADAVREHPTLTNFKIQDSSILPEGASLLMEALSTTGIKSLTLDYGKLSSKTKIFIAPSCTHLDLSNNNIGQAGATQLYKILKKSQLESLSVAGDLTVGTEGVIKISGALKKNRTLRFLNISYTESEDEAINQLLAEAMDHPTLKEIDIRGNTSLSKPLILKCQNLDPAKIKVIAK